MKTHSLRWKQRFENFTKAYSNLEKATQLTSMSELERAGLIQFFEFTFELAWKTMKDYLNSEGYDINTPREAIKQAFQIELISDGHSWLTALDDRNTLTHTYDLAKSIAAEEKIKQDYLKLLTQFKIKLDTLNRGF